MKTGIFCLGILGSVLYGTLCFGQVRSFKTHDKGGQLRSVKHQGLYMGCGVPLGTDSLFNKQGRLIRTTTYIYVKEEPGQGCHAIQCYSKQTTFKMGKASPTVTYYMAAYEGVPVQCTAATYQMAKRKASKQGA